MKTIAVPRGNPNVPLSDETLVSLILEGHDVACTLLVKRYENLLHFVLQSYLPSLDDRQEVVQDTFLRAFRALPHFRGESKLGTWLSKIARSQAISRLRTRRYASWEAIDSTLSSWEADLDNNEEVFEKQEASQMLRMAVRQLSPNDARALELFYFYEQSLEEIETLTGWKANTIKTRLFRARKRLQATLLSDSAHAAYFA